MTDLKRRHIIQAAGAVAAAGVLGLPQAAAAKAGDVASEIPSDGGRLKGLAEALAKAPRRRDFKTVPMILTKPSEWDDEALRLVLDYKSPHKQAWDNTVIGGPWLNLMRNSLNAQIWSFRHPDFLVVSATHGSAHLALLDQSIWDKYQLTKLAGDKFKTNTLIEDAKGATADAKDFENADGVYSPANNSIPALMKRGVVFLSCHNAIWEEAGKLIKSGANPDKLTHEQIAADLTNHLLPGVVLTPGAVGTLPELQRAGFAYAT
ncbi:thiosulfate dehydrogenase [Aquamicrobium soli]|uniref:Transcriptional initiation protein Tat n=1 Tax=Aquamicrobium soli TaxID=1811518 RepID=A0ABV7KBU0_9HYPH